MRLIRVGIVGLGGFGEARLLALRGIDGVEVVALCDRDPERLETVGARFGVARRTTDVAELAEDRAIDAVIVATPEDAHRGPALAALRGSKDVLVEKPLAMRSEEARELCAAAEAAGRILMPGHTVRFETRYAMAKQALEDGALGSLVSLSARRNRGKEAQRRYLRVHPVFETAIHDIDVAVWFAGQRVAAVSGWERRVQGAATDAVWLALEFEGGALAMLESYWLLPDVAGLSADDGLTVVGTSGVARVDLASSGLMLWTETGARVQNAAYAPRLRGTAFGAIREELTYFLRCVRRRVPTDLVPVGDAVHGVEVAEAAVEAGRTGARVNLARRGPG